MKRFGTYLKDLWSRLAGISLQPRCSVLGFDRRLTVWEQSLKHALLWLFY